MEKLKKTYFSKQFKRIALIEYSKGKSAREVFKILGHEILSDDKKYASKLIHKWKMEFYDKLCLPELSIRKLDKNLLMYEIENIIDDIKV